jgi:hypothetical protein
MPKESKNHGVTAYCDQHIDKSAHGWWLQNETPIVCDSCDTKASWIVVESINEVRNAEGN